MRSRCRARLGALLLATLAAWPAAASDTLRIGITVPPPSRGNPYTGNGPPGTYVWLALFDSLTRLDEHGRLSGGLALDWQATSPTEWRFRLRPGVRFSNGKPVDAAAIAATFAWLKSPAGSRTVIGNELRNVVGARVIDPGTLLIVTRKPDASLPNRLTAVMIVEPEAWARLGPEGFAKAPIGSGPYLVDSWGEKDRRIVLVANRYAWRAPRIPRLEFWAMPDNSVRLQALIAREIDLSDAATDDLPYLEARGLKSLHAPAMQVMSWAFVTERPGHSPLKDVRVRRALNYAVDKQAISKVLLRGLGLPGSQPATPVTPGYDPSITPYPYDPARARALLTEAGYPRGFPLDVEVVVTSTAGDGAIYQVVAQNLADVGVPVKLKARTFPDFLKNYLAGNWTSDAFGLSWNAAPYNDVTRPMEYFSCRKRKPFFCDPALAAELERVNAEFDPARRTDLLRRLSRAYHDAAPALFIVNSVDVFAMQPEVQGAAITNRIPAYERLWFSAPVRRVSRQ